MRGLVQLTLMAVVSAMVTYSTVEGHGTGYAQAMEAMTRKRMAEMKRRQEGMTAEKEVMETEEKLPDERCKEVGQFLTIPGESCSFLVCDYGQEPWKDRSGNVKLFTTKMPCAPGTYVQGEPTYRDPCIGRHSMMCFPKKNPETLEEALMQQDADYKYLANMVDEQMEAVEGMDFEQVLRMVRKLGNLLQTQMYTVLELTPNSSSDIQKDMMNIKEDVDKLSNKADHVGYGSRTMGMTEMKDMCMEMMEVMKELAHMKAELKAEMKAEMEVTQMMQTYMAGRSARYGSSGTPPQRYKPRMIVVPTAVSPSRYQQGEMEPEMEKERQGYGEQGGQGDIKKQVKKVVRMMKEIMEMMHVGYDVPQMMTEMRRRMQNSGMSRYSQMMEPMMKEMMTAAVKSKGYEEDSQMMSSVSGYNRMTPMTKARKRTRAPREKPTRKSKPRAPGYGQMAPVTQPKKRTTSRKQKRRPRKMSRKSMQTRNGYGMTVTQAPSAMMGGGYGQMEEVEESPAQSVPRRTIYVLYPRAAMKETGNRASEMRQPERSTYN